MVTPVLLPELINDAVILLVSVLGGWIPMSTQLSVIWQSVRFDSFWAVGILCLTSAPVAFRAMKRSGPHSLINDSVVC